MQSCISHGIFLDNHKTRLFQQQKHESISSTTKMEKGQKRFKDLFGNIISFSLLYQYRIDFHKISTLQNIINLWVDTKNYAPVHVRSSFSSDRMNDILSRNLSRESILQTKYMAFNKFASWFIWTYNILTTRKKSYPSDCNPPMNSCFENSHIVAAFMCHETTNWNNNKNLCYQNSAKPSSHLLDNSSRHRTFINCSFYRLQLKILESEFESGINE